MRAGRRQIQDIARTHDTQVPTRKMRATIYDGWIDAEGHYHGVDFQGHREFLIDHFEELRPYPVMSAYEFAYSKGWVLVTGHAYSRLGIEWGVENPPTLFAGEK